jgi:hypothetical protein
MLLYNLSNEKIVELVEFCEPCNFGVLGSRKTKVIHPFLEFSCYLFLGNLLLFPFNLLFHISNFSFNLL